MDPEAIRKTFKYKLVPTPQQEQALDLVLYRCRELYNAALQERREAWQKRRVSITAASQSAQLPGIKEVRPEYREVNAQVLQDVLSRLDRAFQAFFRRVKAAETPGYPRFKGRERYRSFTYKQLGNGVTLDNGFLVLSRIGRLAVRWSRPLEGTPKTVTIIRDADGWYVCISCADIPCRPLPRTGEETGIDLGLESFATLADGSAVPNPRVFHVAEMNLKRAQRRVTRRQEGSHRRKKAMKLLAKAHQKVRRARANFHHQQALSLVRRYDTIYHEALQVANMMRNHVLAKSISDAGWGKFCAILAFKAAYAGKRVVAVPPAFTSQVCSDCGVMVQKGLSVRWHSCPECGASLHRDHNAALNILRLGHTVGPGMAPQATTQPAGAYVA
jgi:putative transposase